MKRSIFLTIMCVLVGYCYAQVGAPESRNQSAPKETVVFDKIEHDFGTVSESGGVVEFEFVFKNTGNEPIILTRVQPGCGCTAADYTKEPIAPGKKGFVKVSYDPKGRKSAFTNNVTVYTNGNPERITLKIKGDIK